MAPDLQPVDSAPVMPAAAARDAAPTSTDAPRITAQSNLASRVRLLLMITAMLVLVSLALPWYGSSIDQWSGIPPRHARNATSIGLVHLNLGGYVVTSQGVIATGDPIIAGTSIYAASAIEALSGATTIVMLAGVLALIVSMYMFRRKTKGDRIDRRVFLTAVLVALILLTLGPLMFAAGMPAAIKQDITENSQYYVEPNHNTPTKSFFGGHVNQSGSGPSAVGIKMRWGGDVGWFAAVLPPFGLVGVLVLVRKGRFDTIGV